MLKGHAQTDFRPGYYITWENDTVNGLIDYRSEIRNSKLCEYKPENHSKTKKLNPEEIKSYRFTDGEYFVSKDVQYKDTKATYFLEILVILLQFQKSRSVKM